MKRILIISIMCAAVIFAGMAGAQAEVIYDSFGPGDTYRTDSGWTIGGTYDSDTSAAFVLTDTCTLDTIELAVWLEKGTNEVELWLTSDSGGEPGSVIETFSFVDQMVANPGSILLGNSTLHPVLDAGTQYWLVASAPASDTLAAWNSSLSGEGLRAWRHTLSPSWTVTDTSTEYGINLAVFRITGTPVSVPEPSTLLLLGTGLAGAAILRRRFKN